GTFSGSGTGGVDETGEGILPHLPATWQNGPAAQLPSGEALEAGSDQSANLPPQGVLRDQTRRQPTTLPTLGLRESPATCGGTPPATPGPRRPDLVCQRGGAGEARWQKRRSKGRPARALRPRTRGGQRSGLLSIFSSRAASARRWVKISRCCHE